MYNKPLVFRAEDLRIGGRFGTTRSGDPVHVKALHELCINLPVPHVHVVTGQGHECLPFKSVIGRATS